MRLYKHQKGLNIWSFSFNLFLLGFAVFVTLKLFPVYMEDIAVGTAVESLELDHDEYLGALRVRETLIKRFDINNVTRVGKDKISITRDGREYVVQVIYDVEVPFLANISLIVHFEHEAVVRASA